MLDALSILASPWNVVNVVLTETINNFFRKAEISSSSLRVGPN